MKPNRLILPVLTILLGILLLLNAVLPWNIPIWKALIALFLIWLGFGMFGGSGEGEKEVALFTCRTKVEADGKDREYTHAFCSADINLTDLEQIPKRLAFNAVFSSVRLRLPVDANIHIHACGAFCSVNLPGGQNLAFGEEDCDCGSRDANAPAMRVDINCVFGTVHCVMG